VGLGWRSVGALQFGQGALLEHSAQPKFEDEDDDEDENEAPDEGGTFSIATRRAVGLAEAPSTVPTAYVADPLRRFAFLFCTLV